MDEQTRKVMEQVDRAERESFVALYEAAARLGTGWREETGVTGVWAGYDDDPGFSCLFDLDEAPDPNAAIIRFERIFREAGAAVIGIDVSEDTENAVSAEWLTGRGYEAAYEEQVMARPVADIHREAEPEELRISLIGPACADSFSRVINRGFGLAPNSIRGPIFASTVGLPDWSHYLVEIDGHAAAAAVLFTYGGVADFFLAATVPEFRGRGAQTALINRRLADAGDAGCDLATAQAIMTSASPRNFSRHGFQPIYRRRIYGKRLSAQP